MSPHPTKRRDLRRKRPPKPLRVAVDTGGTFTDVLVFSGGALRSLKVPSTPADPSLAVARALHSLGVSCDLLLHGTTVGTNTLLTRSGSRVGLVTTRGFEDVLEIGRQNRPALYDLHVRRRDPLVPASARLGVPERLDAAGRVVEPLDEKAAREVARRLAARGIRSVAVCFLHAYRSPRHERAAGRLLRRAGLSVSLSSRVLAEFREYERTVVTVLNAYLAERMGGYLSRLGRQVGRDRLGVMQSNGGVLSAREAARMPVRTLLSGPAAGVVGGFDWARRAGFARAITFDMGGTSTDVSLCPGDIETTRESEIAGLPVAIPMIRIHTVGAGGGSIARVDEGGALRVGPESAGADPGPACYGRGREATVTDAHLHLGRLRPDAFLGGTFPLDTRRAEAAVGRLARRAGLDSGRTAEGVLEVVEQTMEAALRRISVERGHDPREFCLVVFGGAGGLHAFELASRLGVRSLLVPPHPGLLSAWGLAVSPVVRETSRSVLHRVEEDRFDPSELEEDFRRIERELERALARDPVLRAAPGAAGPRLSRSADLRYRGQSFELRVPWSRRLLGDFHRLHRTRYGHDRRGDVVEIVTIRTRAEAGIGRPRPPRPRAEPPPDGGSGRAATRYRGERLELPVLARDALAPGRRIAGPALILEYSATHFVPPGARGRVGRFGEILFEVPPRGREGPL
jgi:N-methylhydantoinase A